TATDDRRSRSAGSTAQIVTETVARDEQSLDQTVNYYASRVGRPALEGAQRAPGAAALPLVSTAGANGPCRWALPAPSGAQRRLRFDGNQVDEVQADGPTEATSLSNFVRVGQTRT